MLDRNEKSQRKNESSAAIGSRLSGDGAEGSFVRDSMAGYEVGSEGFIRFRFMGVHTEASFHRKENSILDREVGWPCSSDRLHCVRGDAHVYPVMPGS